MTQSLERVEARFVAKGFSPSTLYARSPERTG
jgi:hypothetical protein